MRDENRERLGPNDVVLAAYPGSGASWIGTLLVQLGVFFVSGHDEILIDTTSQRTGGWIPEPKGSHRTLAADDRKGGSIDRPSMGFEDHAKHLPGLGRRDQVNRAYREPCRVIKTNQSAMGWTPPAKVVHLIRDGRDAVLSLYHHLRSFGDLNAPLLEFLQGNQGAWALPAMAWGFSCMSWSGLMPPDRLHVLRFEACRQQPFEEFRALLGFLGIERGDDEIGLAIEESSYARMRQKEDESLQKHLGQTKGGRIMRKGQVGEWREVYTEEMLTTFKGLPRRALQQFGYPVDSIPH